MSDDVLSPKEKFQGRAFAAWQTRNDPEPQMLAFTMVNQTDVIRAVVYAVGEEGILVRIPGMGIYRFRYDQLNYFPPEGA